MVARITHAITTVNSKQTTDSSLHVGKKSREKQLCTQNVYACLFMYIPNGRSTSPPLIEKQLSQPLGSSFKWRSYNFCPQVHSLGRNIYIYIVYNIYNININTYILKIQHEVSMMVQIGTKHFIPIFLSILPGNAEQDLGPLGMTF